MILKLLQKRASEIKINKFYTLSLAESVSFADIEGFINNLEESAKEDIDEEVFYYPNKDNIKIEYRFWKPNKSYFGCLTLGSTMGLNARCISSDLEEHLKGCFYKSGKSITWDTNEKAINIIAVEANGYDNIDIGEALFGTEEVVYPIKRWQKAENGLFNDSEFTNKFAFVLTLRMEERQLFGTYTNNLFVNEIFKDRINEINSLIDITADQFSEIKDQVLITRDRTWHMKFRKQSRSDGDFEKFASYNKFRLTMIYKYIMLRISQIKTD